MRRIDLGRYRRRVVVGSSGNIVLTGPGVKPRHVEFVLTPGDSHGLVLRPLEGEVWVERGPVLTVIRGDFLLADGDVVVLGSHRMHYRNVAAAHAGTRVEEMIRWLS